MPTRDYRLEVFQAGDDTSGTVDFTVGSQSSHDLPIAHPIPDVSVGTIRPLEGDVRSVSFPVKVLDESGTMTGHLSDSGGRMDLRERTVRWSVSSDAGSNWTTIFTGRLDGVIQEDPTLYRLQIIGERQAESDITLFTAEQLSDAAFPFVTGTTTIYPHGIRPDRAGVYRFAPFTRLATWEVVETGPVKLRAVGGSGTQVVEASQKAVRVLQDDVIDHPTWGNGNFEHTRFRHVTVSGTKPYDGTDYELEAFGGTSSRIAGETNSPVAALDKDPQAVRHPILKSGPSVNVGDTISGFIYAPTRPPDRLLPLHIGYGEPLNLLGPRAHQEYTFTDVHNYLGKEPLSNLGLSVGDSVSVGMDLKTSGDSGSKARILVQFFDSGDSSVSVHTSSPTSEATTTYERREIEDITVPANAVSVTVRSDNQPNDGSTLFSRQAVFNKGSTALRSMDPSFDQDPLAIIRALYDFVGIRYDESVLGEWDSSSNPRGLLNHPSIRGLVQFRLRLTRTWNLRRFTSALYRMFGIVPLQRDGKLSPTRFLLPSTDVVSDPTTAFTLRAIKSGSNEANVSGQMPSWQHNPENHTTRVVATWTQDVNAERLIGEGISPRSDGRALFTFAGIPRSDSLDRITTEEHTETTDHDRIDQFGIKEHEVEMIGLRTKASAQAAIDALSGEILDRFGDGAVEMELDAIETATDASGNTPDDQEPGDFVNVVHEALPNPDSGDRSGTDFAQILDKSKGFGSLRLYLLRAGASQQHSSTPTLAIAKESGNESRGITATISGLDASADTWALWLAFAGSQPPAHSDKWYMAARPDDDTASWTVSGLPSGNTIWARAQAWENGRPRSGFSNIVSVTLEGIPAPSNLEDEVVLGDFARLSFTPGDTSLPTEFRLDRGDGLEREAVYPPGIATVFATDLDLNTSYTAGVRHIDPDITPPGVSSEATDSFTTTGTADDPDDSDPDGDGDDEQPGNPGAPRDPFRPDSATLQPI